MARGRRIQGPGRDQANIRPSSDRVREALFNILGHDLRDLAALDLFCGVGSLGLEALSRGAAPVVFVDRSRTALSLTARNLHNCFSSAHVRLLRLDLSRDNAWTRISQVDSERIRFNLVFLDPPYEKNLAQQALKMVEVSGLLAPDGLVIAEERAGQKLPDKTGSLRLTDQRQYGETGLWLYEHTSTP